MAQADVGDDGYGEDPTVNRLQQEVAARLGKPAGLFVPSGVMANQVALRVHCHHGDDVLIGEEAHNQWHENGAAAALAGVQISVLGQGGLFRGADVEAAFKPDNQLYPPTRLLCVENTHNRGGGRVWPLGQIEEVCAAGRKLGLALHLDGARLWNAEVQSGISAATLAAPFDTVSVCLSKGLGAPVGSVLVGSKEAIHRARRYRQMYGGGMRQAGVLAAAGLYALANHVTRLAEDHEHARLIGERLSRLPHVRLVAEVETNIVVFDVLEPLPMAQVVAARLRERGVLMNAFGKRRLRAVTHLDVNQAGCEQACDVLAELLGQAP